MFPYGPEFRLNANLTVNYQIILDHIGPLLTDDRKAKIEKVAAYEKALTLIAVASSKAM